MHISWNHKEPGRECKGQRATAIPSRSCPSGNYVVSKWSRAGGTTTSNSIMKAASGCSIVGSNGVSIQSVMASACDPNASSVGSRPSWCWKILNLKFMAHPQRRSIKTPRFEIYNYSFLYFPAAPHVCHALSKSKRKIQKTSLDNTCWKCDLLGNNIEQNFIERKYLRINV